jgi:hypothetical protein
MTDEVVFVRASDLEILAPRRDWHGWTLRGTVLSYPAYANGNRYGFELTRFVSSARMLDIIMQVDGKTWATAHCLAGLIHALNDILRPQATLCSMGRDKWLMPGKITAMCVKAGRNRARTNY